MDRRIAKTQKALVEALQQGLTKHPWEDITVQMLCDTADVSRSTFYSHFESKEALLTLGMEWLSQHLQADDKGGRGLDLNGKIAILPAVLRHMDGHLFLFDTTRASMPGRELSYQFEQKVKSIIQGEIASSRYATLITPDQVIYMIGGLFAVLDQWRINRCEEQIDELLGKLDNLIAQTIKINA